MSSFDLLAEDSQRESTMMSIHKASRPITVNIRDHNYNTINPSPIKMPKNSELLEEFLSPRKLQALTGVEDLQTVEYLEMRVNTEQMSLGNFGMYLPNLSQIKLSGSYVPSIRDLGTSLSALQVLWMPQCSLHCLDGLVTMCNIKELYLAYNEVEDISSCGMLENLEILDLEGNLIADVTGMYYLSMCHVLSRLTLEGNPLCNPNNFVAPQTYRKSVFEIITQLKYLDDLSPNYEKEINRSGDDGTSVDQQDNSNATLEFEEHWRFINSVLIESGLLSESVKSSHHDPILSQSLDDSARPSSSMYTNSSRPNTSKRPFSSQRSSLTSSIVRPQSSSSCYRIHTANTVDSGNDTEEQQEESSLTAGKIVCGSITKSLRRKSAEKISESPRGEEYQDIMSPLTSDQAETEKAKRKESSDGDSCELVLKELEEWRRDYARTKTRIELQRAPQVLTIEYSDEDIEEVKIPIKITAPKLYEMDESIKSSKKLKEKTEIKLNPVRNGKIPLKDLPSSWVPRDKKIKSAEASSSKVSPVTSPHNQTAPPMSRIRKQLIQSGVSVMMPSKPIYKK